MTKEDILQGTKGNTIHVATEQNTLLWTWRNTHTQLKPVFHPLEKTTPKWEMWVINYTQLFHGKQQAAFKSKNILWTLSPVFIFSTFLHFAVCSFGNRSLLIKE